MVIGFESTVFAVREDEMAVEVCAVVIEGSVNIPLQVSINTEDGTAIGEIIASYIISKTHFEQVFSESSYH